MLLASFTSDLYEMGTFSRAPGRGGGGGGDDKRRDVH